MEAAAAAAAAEEEEEEDAALTAEDERRTDAAEARREMRWGSISWSGGVVVVEGDVGAARRVWAGEKRRGARS